MASQPSYNAPTEFYGAIPPILSQNFAIFERLGFLTNSPVPPESAANNWNNRNQLLPLITALARTYAEHAETTNADSFASLGQIARLLTNSAPYARSLTGLLAAFAAQNGFAEYLYDSLQNDYQLPAILLDLEHFLNSDPVRSTAQTEQSLFYSAGTLLQFFADLAEHGKKPDPQGYWFEDHWNTDEENSSYFDYFNFMLSRK